MDMLEFKPQPDITAYELALVFRASLQKRWRFGENPPPVIADQELVDYIAQSGDTLAALAIRFNTTVEEILTANPFIPADATTMPPGMPMKIPIYYLSFWGSQYQILPDSLFVNGPAQVDFDTQAFVDASPGWLKDAKTFANGKNIQGGEIIELVSANFSISPRLQCYLLGINSEQLRGIVGHHADQPGKRQFSLDNSFRKQDRQHRLDPAEPSPGFPDILIASFFCLSGTRGMI